MLETVVIVLGALLLASLLAVVFLVRATTKSNDRFFDFADRANDYLARANTDLANKVLSHSDDFLEMKRIERPDTQPTQMERAVVHRPPTPENAEWTPQGGFEDVVKQG